jgi:tetratricopeptide (TPR) repeat protein/DNA-binding CsgD family transcriptional regulator
MSATAGPNPGTSRGSGAMLLERETELAAVATLLDTVGAGHGAVLWIEGPAGIGKTRLLEVACCRAEAAGMRVLTARASDLEREFAFGVIRSLFEPLLTAMAPAERDELLVGAARLAVPVITLDGLAPTMDGTDNAASLGTLHGLYWLTANLAEGRPLMLAVDDGHWTDMSSLRALAYLARRICDLPVALVVAARPAGPEVDIAAVDALQDEPITVVLRPGPLSRDGTDVLIRSKFGARSEEAFRTACHEATGGNPLLLCALLDALVQAGVAPNSDGVAAVAQRAPAIVATSVFSRMRHLPPAAAAVARAVAVLRSGAPLRHVAVLAGLDPTAAADAAESLVTAQLLTPGRPLAFVHPLIEEAVAERMSSAERHHVHRTAARLLAAEGAAPEFVAAHLLYTEPLGDPDVVDALRTAARAALAKGAPEPATSYLRRALDEPPDPAQRPDVLLELGSAAVQVSFTEGVALLEQAFADASQPTKRAMAALELARSLRTTLNYQSALTVLDDAIAGLGDDEAELRLTLEAEAVGLARRDPDRRASAADRTRRLQAAGALSGRAGAMLLANSALDALQPDTGSRAAELAEEALAVTLAQDVPDPGVLLPATMVLVATDRLEPLVAACETAIASARRRGSTYDFASASVLRAQARYLQGALGEAEADARLADHLTAEHNVPSARRYTQAWLVLTLVERGRLAEADESLERSEVMPTLAYLLDAHGRLRLAQGRAAEALDDFRACGRRLDQRGIGHPGLMPWRANAALALHQLGRIDEACRLVSEAVQTARNWSAPRALGLALRARGLVDGSVDALREAVAVLEATPARLEHARALVDLGAALRRGNQRSAARVELARGQELAHRCDAGPLVGLARKELAAAGARPRTMALSGIEALTPSERRVAELAAGGLSNRDVAQALFVTTKTVETHLGSVYRKLAIDGRTDLADALT